MTTQPQVGSDWARRVPGFPEHDFRFRVTGVFTVGEVTYIETKDLDSGGLRRGRLEHIFEFAEPIGDT
ncbi:hypothetical protein [Streptomyces antibioticus]|uniref:Uncharacterized protein n=1 Tax=Streptomyces antibioticus TaxID=1890 RepID=A0AAE6Y9B5_STRAT|nr:hypothetical protein [Streptomyces antibioticus]QIT45461.1 hypothetical protein HCX60_19565 [Streptomyces antibioticus]